MNKNFIFIILFIAILNLSLVSSLTLNSSEQQKRINQAYSCLDNKIKSKCSLLSTEEKIFSVLATGQCKQELISSAKNGECWTQTTGDCKIKTTAQAILALNNFGSNTQKQINWLLNKTKNPTELVWYLQIDSNGAASCTINYRGQIYNVNIDENKFLSNNAGACLNVAENGYWFQISPSCYNEDISISCNKDFFTSLLFRKATSSTINVLPEISSASTGGTTKEKVESLCFVEGNSCNYEGTLWATLVLSFLGQETKQYMPYLVALADENPRFIPESFLAYITGDNAYKTNLISKQKENSYWLESGDKFYDTALALYPLKKEAITEVENSKNWLLTNQDKNGCWQDNLRNTAFILFSVWPKEFSTETSTKNCEDSGFFCTTVGSCEGEILSSYSCPSSYKCCSKRPAQTTCSELGGIICSRNQRCIGGNTLLTPDLKFEEVCCTNGGSCQETGESPKPSECENQGGSCRIGSCGDKENEVSFSCTTQSEVCCFTKIKEKKSSLWIWVLIILIALVILGIIFKEKLRHYLFKIKNSFGKGGPTGTTTKTPPKAPPYYPQPVHRTVEKHYIPVQTKTPIRKASSNKELDEVLKKLKEMSK
jgi:hypothetical protein